MLIAIGIIAATFAGQANSLRLETTRDLWVSGVGSEVDGNNGGAGKLKLKSIQEFSLVDFDLAPAKGRVVRSAKLHLRSTGEPSLHRVTVGSIASEWFEGTASNYEKQDGSSSFRSKRYPKEPWTADGGDICRVILGNCGSIWGMADASPPDADGWQTISVDPKVIAARVAGVSHGFLVFDDTGSEWKRDGEKFERTLFPNRFVYSRESNKSRAPYLTLELGVDDPALPKVVTDLRCDPAELPSGQTWISWTTPEDRGTGVVGFFAKIDEEELPRYLIPPPGKPGEMVRVKITDPSPRRQEGATLFVRAVDGAGNLGPWSRIPWVTSSRSPKPLPEAIASKPAIIAPLPRLGKAEVGVIDELDKLPPSGGAMIPPQPDNYLAANHLWDAESREIHVHAARNEFVAFQVVVLGEARGVKARLEFDGVPKTSIGVYRSVATSKGPLPDPIVPLSKPVDFPDKGQKSGSLHVEVYVPPAMPPGLHRGKFIMSATGAEPLTLPVSLRVWDFTLPDSLSFLPEMNCYDLPYNERSYYRLAHEHRVVLNCLPYSQDGRVHVDCAPKWDGKTLDWTEWDRRFGAYLDGSAFGDLTRPGVPIEGFYLPIHENWPTPMKGNYNNDFWADRAFTEQYRRDFVEVSRQFAEHFHQKKWGGTLFHAFLNNKVDFKLKGWSRGSSPWLLDEPANFQDFWALRYFGTAFHEGFNAAGEGPAKMLFRCDISRPQWQRDSLDDVLDLNIIGGAMRTYLPIVMDRKQARGEIVIEYGSSNAIEESNIQPVAWSLDVWTLGGDGVLPWQTVGNEKSWSKADELSLFYPKREGEAPIPSVRLKAYRRGQQDVEYLTLWSQATDEPRWAVAANVRRALSLNASRKNSGGEDAGQMTYQDLTPKDLWALRMRVGEGLSKLHPEPKRKLVDFRTPRRELPSRASKLIP